MNQWFFNSFDLSLKQIKNYATDNTFLPTIAVAVQLQLTYNELSILG